MISKKRLLGIPELYIAKIVLKMNESQMEEFVHDLKSFVEIFPVKEAELKNALEVKNYLDFSECAASIREMLMRIHADELAQECNKLIEALTGAKHEKVEALMTYMLSLLTMLSIDIQMAVYKDDGLQHGGDTDNESEAKTSEQDSDSSLRELDDLLQGNYVSKDEQYAVRSGNILAVDDNAFFLDTLRTALQGTGYKLICVSSGVAALKYLEKNEPDLFILDIEMPEMDGYELAKKVRGRGFKAPILFLTGNATKEYVTNAIKAGAADFIVKPITQKQVLERIGKFI